MMHSNRLLNEIEHRLVEILQQLKDGQDCPPSAQLRLEGLMEAAVMLGLSTRSLEQDRFEAIFARINNTSPSDALGSDWRAFFAFPSLPLFANRAPVMPSTSD